MFIILNLTKEPSILWGQLLKQERALIWRNYHRWSNWRIVRILVTIRGPRLWPEKQQQRCPTRGGLYWTLWASSHQRALQLCDSWEFPFRSDWKRVRKATTRLGWSIFHYGAGNIRENLHQVETTVSKL